MHSTGKILITFGFFLIILTGFISCSRSEPTIAFGFIKLVYYQDKDKFNERYTFFIIPEDEEGIENLEDLYLYHDGDQLRWQIKSSDWIKFSKDGKDWIGSRSLAIQDGEMLPRGQFRAVLVTKGGEKSEKKFSFDAPEEPRFPFPTLTVKDGNYSVKSVYPANHLIFYDSKGEYLFHATLSALTGKISELGPSTNARTVALWAEDTNYFTSVITDAVSTR